MDQCRETASENDSRRLREILERRVFYAVFNTTRVTNDAYGWRPDPIDSERNTAENRSTDFLPPKQRSMDRNLIQIARIKATRASSTNNWTSFCFKGGTALQGHQLGACYELWSSFIRTVRYAQTPLGIGLDPHLDRLPRFLRQSYEGLEGERFCLAAAEAIVALMKWCLMLR